ncbi:MAG TPA: hypothetical protein VMO78_13540 [Rhizomicrobium sp.]|nr:hypothetical protein [Rhizomicrobium sp.]
MTTLFHMSVEKSRKRPAELPPEARAFDVLKSRLPPDAVALAVADWPGIVICHKGRAFGLQMKLPGIPLTLAQTNAVIAMRGAGMRVDIAQGPDQAIARAHEMGVALKEDERHGLRDVFRKETRRRS